VRGLDSTRTSLRVTYLPSVNILLPDEGLTVKVITATQCAHTRASNQFVIVYLVKITNYNYKLLIKFTTMKFKTFAFTHRPRNGVTDEDVRKISDYLKKVAEYHKVITEKLDDQRHVHSVFILKKESTRSNVSIQLSRLFPELDPEEKRVMLGGLRIWNDLDYLDYLDKDDDTEVIESNLPEAHYIEAFLPEKREKVTKHLAN